GSPKSVWKFRRPAKTWPATASSWAVDVGLDPAVPSMGGGRLTVEADGAWTWTDGARSASGAAGTCTVSTRWSSPQTWLDDLFAAP
ncbi:MAG TPA: hypothetical protein PKA64_27010, partial [Myxococcota bacterium]|nr:hypothetical protein [Myxococcota bacterium]